MFKLVAAAAAFAGLLPVGIASIPAQGLTVVAATTVPTISVAGMIALSDDTGSLFGLSSQYCSSLTVSAYTKGATHGTAPLAQTAATAAPSAVLASSSGYTICEYTMQVPASAGKSIVLDVTSVKLAECPGICGQALVPVADYPSACPASVAFGSGGKVPIVFPSGTSSGPTPTPPVVYAWLTEKNSSLTVGAGSTYTVSLVLTESSSAPSIP